MVCQIAGVNKQHFSCTEKIIAWWSENFMSKYSVGFLGGGLAWILALEQEVPPKLIFNLNLLEMVNFKELIHPIPNFLEIGFLLSV